MMQGDKTYTIVTVQEQPGDIKMVMFDSASKGLTIVMESGDQYRLEQRYSATHTGLGGGGYGGAFITLAALLLAQHERITALERAAAVESPVAGNA